jgi:hypothetical protein
VVEVAVRDDDRLGVGGLDWKPWRVVRQDTEIEQERAVDEERAPTDLASAAEEPNVHLPGVAARDVSLHRSAAVVGYADAS